MEAIESTGGGLGSGQMSRRPARATGHVVRSLAAGMAGLVVMGGWARADDLVVDDRALSSGFVARLSKLPEEGGFPKAKAKQQVAEATGRKVAPGLE